MALTKEKIFLADKESFERLYSDVSTKEYMKQWNAHHDWEFKQAREYVEKIRQAQQAASLKAIEEIIA